MKNKNKSITKLFIAASLTAIAMFGALYLLILNISFVKTIEPSIANADKYYLNKNLDTEDPFITKNPQLKDILRGPIISSLDPGFGELDAPVTIVEFSDYECSFCYEQEVWLKSVLEKYQNKVRLIWKDYPVSRDPESLSFKAAVAARCAREQDQFGAYHDLLFENKLDEDIFIKLAVDTDLDLDYFRKCIKNERIINQVNDNIKEANALGINGVPFIYVNDQEILGQITIEDLNKIIDKELFDLAAY